MSKIIFVFCGHFYATVAAIIFLQPMLALAVDTKPTDSLSTAMRDKTVDKYSDRKNAVTKISENGKYRVSLFSGQYPIPMNKIHDWILHVENTQGQHVKDVEIFVFGGMPAHQHGFPTKPRVTGHSGDGDYNVEGIKFSMMGHWQIRFNIKDAIEQDRVVFDVNIQ